MMQQCKTPEDEPMEDKDDFPDPGEFVEEEEDEEDDDDDEPTD